MSPAPGRTATGARVALTVLGAISVCHLLNDTMQSLLPAIYPLLQSRFRLSFGQIGLITLAYQLTASLLQPLVGYYTDRRQRPYALVYGTSVTFVGLLLLATAGHFLSLVIAASLVGIGSAVFHPESSRVARLASGGRHGFAQSLFQVGGNAGTAIGPLLAAFIVVRFGQPSIAWVALLTLPAIAVLWRVGRWSAARQPGGARSTGHAERPQPIFALHGARKGAAIMVVLVALLFSKYIYLASLTSYYTFYLISKFHLSVAQAQLHLFVFLGAAAVGTILGGPIGDRLGRKMVIWVSILGVLPFTLALPYANLLWTELLSVVIGLLLASAFPAILVYAQEELAPGNVGLISGLFFGFAFGLGGIGAAALGWMADHVGLTTVYHLCSYLPALGVLAGFLPASDRHVRIAREPIPEPT